MKGISVRVNTIVISKKYIDYVMKECIIKYKTEQNIVNDIREETNSSSLLEKYGSF